MTIFCGVMSLLFAILAGTTIPDIIVSKDVDAMFITGLSLIISLTYFFGVPGAVLD